MEVASKISMGRQYLDHNLSDFHHVLNSHTGISLVLLILMSLIQGDWDGTGASAFSRSSVQL